MHPTSPQLVGTNVLDMRDAAGAPPVQGHDRHRRPARMRASIDITGRRTPRRSSSRATSRASAAGTGSSAAASMSATSRPRSAASCCGSPAPAGVALCVVVVLAIVVGRGITRPIAALTGVMRRLAAGDLAAEVPAQERRDELGAMAAAVVVFKDHMVTAGRLAQRGKSASGGERDAGRAGRHGGRHRSRSRRGVGSRCTRGPPR